MKIKTNKKAPNFKLDSTVLKPFELSKSKNALIIYFYPKDNTPGCTLETKDFSKLYKKFKSLKYEVVGISKDDIKSHLGFKKKYKVPFQLLSDEKSSSSKKIWCLGKKIIHGNEIYGNYKNYVFNKLKRKNS